MSRFIVVALTKCSSACRDLPERLTVGDFVPVHPERVCLVPRVCRLFQAALSASVPGARTSSRPRAYCSSRLWWTCD